MSIAQIIGNYDNPTSLGSKFRRRRSAPLKHMIEGVFVEKSAVSILDVGGMKYYWDMFPKEFLAAHKVKITLLNLIDDIRPIKRPEFLEAYEGDGCALPFPNDHFDICHSNSVIEHVGNWHRKVSFAHEMTRVAPHYFHQTPNFWFPWKPHFGMPIYHWLPDPVKLSIARRRKMGWWQRADTVMDGMIRVEHASLLNRHMMTCLFPQARLVEERFLGMTKSFVAVR